MKGFLGTVCGRACDCDCRGTLLLFRGLPMLVPACLCQPARPCSSILLPGGPSLPVSILGAELGERRRDPVLYLILFSSCPPPSSCACCPLALLLQGPGLWGGGRAATGLEDHRRDCGGSIHCCTPGLPWKLVLQVPGLTCELMVSVN